MKKVNSNDRTWMIILCLFFLLAIIFVPLFPAAYRWWQYSQPGSQLIKPMMATPTPGLFRTESLEKFTKSDFLDGAVVQYVSVNVFAFKRVVENRSSDIRIIVNNPTMLINLADRSNTALQKFEVNCNYRITRVEYTHEGKVMRLFLKPLPC